MFIRYRYNIGGGHTHIRMFMGQAPNMTLAKCGDLCMRNEEFEWFRSLMKVDVVDANMVEFVEDEPVADAFESLLAMKASLKQQFGEE